MQALTASGEMARELASDPPSATGNMGLELCSCLAAASLALRSRRDDMSCWPRWICERLNSFKSSSRLATT